MWNEKRFEPVEIGIFHPDLVPVDRLACGEVGYVATGLKSIRDARVGDTLTDGRRTRPPSRCPATAPPSRWSSPASTRRRQRTTPLLRDALEKLHLNDAALTYEPESSVALGFGFRCGFLGLFHMEIVQERLEREYDLDPDLHGAQRRVPGDEDGRHRDRPRQPGRAADAERDRRDPRAVGRRLHRPARPLRRRRDGADDRPPRRLQAHGVPRHEHGDGARANRASCSSTTCRSREILTDFYDQLKSRTQGYASLDYTLAGYEPARLVKLDVLVNNEPVDALTLICHPEDAQARGRDLVEKLRKLIPRQMFDVPIQAAIGGRIIARETIKPDAQERAGEVLRRRRHPQAQAAREAGRGQEAHEAGGQRRDPAGGLHGGPEPRPVAFSLQPQLRAQLDQT